MTAAAADVQARLSVDSAAARYAELFRTSESSKSGVRRKTRREELRSSPQRSAADAQPMDSDSL